MNCKIKDRQGHHCDTECAKLKAYKQGRAEQKAEDNEFFNFEGAWKLEKERIRADVIEEIKKLIKTRLIDNLALEDATKYGNRDARQQANSYSTVMKYEIADCVDDLLDDMNNINRK